MNNSLENPTPNENPEAFGFSAFWNGASTGMKALVILAGVAIVAAIIAIIIVLAGLFGSGGNTPPAGVTPTVVPTPAPGVPTLTATKATNILAGPGTEYHTIGILETGLSAEVAGVSTDGQWWAIKYPPGPDGLGWVIGADVRTQNTDDVPVVVAPPVPTPTTAPPVVITDWKGEYFNNRNLQGDPVVVRNDQTIDFNWGTNPPAEGMPNENWSARWTVERNVPGGTYRFSVWVDDGVRVWVDDTLIIDGWVDGGARNYVAEVNVADGNHRVRVEYFQSTGGALIKLDIGYVNPTPEPGQPTAVINAPTQAQAGQEVQFRGDGSIAAPGSQIMTYEWNFGDGTGSNDVNPTHIYNAEGVYRVKLTVFDSNEQSNASAVDITISAAPVNPPTAIINAPQQAAVGETITFDGGDSRGDNPITTYLWDFGDGYTANAVRVDHAYQNAGDYNVSLTVTDSENQSGSARMQIRIVSVDTPTPPSSNPPTAIISGPTTAKVGAPVSFSGTESTGDTPIVKYDWNFGDGATAEGANVTYTYNAAGSYSVILVVTDNTGLSGNTMSQITISEDVVPTPTTEPPPSLPLEGVIWQYDDALPNTEITALFQNGTLSGTGGCNTYSTGYTVSGSNMTIDPIIIGGVACGDPIDQQEASYFNDLGEVTSYQIKGDKLTLSGPTTTLIFTAGPQPR